MKFNTIGKTIIFTSLIIIMIGVSLQSYELREKVLLKIDGKIPEKYFHKNAKVSFTPILNGEKSETKFKTITLQGEEASGGDKTISYVNGGSFTP